MNRGVGYHQVITFLCNLERYGNLLVMNVWGCLFSVLQLSRYTHISDLFVGFRRFFNFVSNQIYPRASSTNRKTNGGTRELKSCFDKVRNRDHKRLILAYDFVMR